MKRVLLTGGSGFIGRNIKPILEKNTILFAPTRNELDLKNELAVREYIKNNNIEIVIHAANPNPVKNSLDKPESMFEDSIRVFLNLYHAEDLYERMYTLGSGAEYDKSKDISLIKEEEQGRSVPYDTYGLIKYTIDKIIAGSNKQYNLRIFACYGPTDHESKFITHCIRCCLRKEDITIRQDCYFDYMQVTDLANILVYFINHEPKFHSYNVCTGTRVLLSEIAHIVQEEMNIDNRIIVLKEGLNKEYTGDNSRLVDEIGNYNFIGLREGIRIQIESEKLLQNNRD